MKRLALAEELKDWIGDDVKRITFMADEAPTSASTIRSTINGRYVPAPRLERAMRAVMTEYPKGKPLPARRKEAVG